MPREQRPIPDGFREVFRETSIVELTRRFKAGQEAVRRWIGECGGRDHLSSANAYRPCPEGFAEMFGRCPIGEIAKHYNAAPRTIERWRRELGLPPSNIRNRRPMPEDFARVAPTMHLNELARHYRAGREAVNRWVAESGVKSKPVTAESYRPKSLAWGGVSNGIKHKYGNLTVTRPHSIYDEAADVLRKERFKVNRCNDKGGYDPKGGFWRVGWSILTGDELLAKADRYRSRAA